MRNGVRARVVMDIVPVQHVQHVAQQQNIIVTMKLPVKAQREAGAFPNMEEAVGVKIIHVQLILVQNQNLGIVEMKQPVKVQEQAGAAVGVKLALARLVQNLRYGTATQKKLVQEQTGAQVKI